MLRRGGEKEGKMPKPLTEIKDEWGRMSELDNMISAMAEETWQPPIVTRQYIEKATELGFLPKGRRREKLIRGVRHLFVRDKGTKGVFIIQPQFKSLGRKL